MAQEQVGGVRVVVGKRPGQLPRHGHHCRAGVSRPQAEPAQAGDGRATLRERPEVMRHGDDVRLPQRLEDKHRFGAELRQAPPGESEDVRKPSPRPGFERIKRAGEQAVDLTRIGARRVPKQGKPRCRRDGLGQDGMTLRLDRSEEGGIRSVARIIGPT